MSTQKQILKKSCHHEWVKSQEKRTLFDDEIGEHTHIGPIWTCKKCGIVFRSDPTKS